MGRDFAQDGNEATPGPQHMQSIKKRTYCHLSGLKAELTLQAVPAIVRVMPVGNIPPMWPFRR
jgi:hypothetical protein